ISSRKWSAFPCAESFRVGKITPSWSLRVSRERDPEADIVAALARLAGEAIGCAAEYAETSPGPAAQDPALALVGSPGVLPVARVVGSVPVGAPLPDVAAHVEQTERI